MRILSSASGSFSRAWSAVCLAGLLVGSAACDGDTGGLDGGTGQDVAQQPDARVLPPRDATEPELPAPTLTRVSPNEGTVLGGTRVTLRGTELSEPVEVWFGANSASSVTWLDERTVAATSPPGELGAVTVRLVTDGGAAEVPNGFTYVRELRLDRIVPARVPDEGGVEVTLEGEGFTAETVVLLDRRPLRGLRVVDEQTMTGFVPALTLGRPEVRVVTRTGAVRRNDRLVVFGTPDHVSVAPGYGPAEGGAVQELVGEGVGDLSIVRFDGTPGTEVAVAGPERASVLAPATSVGWLDLELQNADATGKIAGAYLAYDSRRVDLHLLGVAPRRVPARTALTVTLVGGGFTPDAQVGIGARRLVARAVDTHAIEVELPADLEAGTLELELSQGASALSTELVVEAPLGLESITPESGPASGGTPFTIIGRGFLEGDVQVRIGDVPVEDIRIFDDETLTGVTVAGAHGPADIELRVDGRRLVLEDAYDFRERFEIVRVEPREGSIAGNTHVSVIGRGFDGPGSVTFGEQVGLSPMLENGHVLAVRTPPSPIGEVDLSVSLFSGTEDMLGAFSFFDPRLLIGGAWGGPVEGAVNVAVIDGDGAPVPDMTVQLGHEADPRYRRSTDANGLATISSPEIRGAQTVTVGGVETQFATFVDVDARNLTFRSGAFPQQPPPDTPINPCPTPQAAPVIRGRIFELKSAIDPETNPNLVPLVQVTYSERDVFTPNPAMPPEQVDVVFQEGEQYEIVTQRAGSVAVYAILGDFDQSTQRFTPRRLGIARGVPVAGGSVTEDVDIALTIDMDETLRIRLDQPPDQSPGLNAVFPFLNLDSDGVIPFTASIVNPGGEVILQNMPGLAESQFFYMGGSFTVGANGGLASPYSLTLVENNAPFGDGVDLGPFLEMPENVSPKANEVFQDRRLTWDHAGPAPDLMTMTVGDARTIAGQCCMDLNGNGVCESDEPLQGGAAPVPFTRWSVFAPGAAGQSLAFPAMPDGLDAFEAPRSYNVSLNLALSPRFSWAEFSYAQLFNTFWQSWVQWNTSLVVKEETR